MVVPSAQLLLVAGLVVLLSVSPASPGELSEYSGGRGQVTDPTGDAEPYPCGLACPDIASASVTQSRDALLLRVRFAAPTFVAASTFVQFSLVLGQEAAQAPGEEGCCGNYIVDIGGADASPGEAQVKRLKPDGVYEVAGTIATTTGPDTITVSVPASLLPKGINRIRYRVVTSVRLDDAVSPILDAIPDSGLAEGALHSGGGRRTTR